LAFGRNQPFMAAMTRSARIDTQKQSRYRMAEASPAILDGAHLTTEAGEHIVIAGRSGVGESTLVKVLMFIAKRLPSK